MNEKSDHDSYLLGQSVGLEEASKLLMEKSNYYWSLEKDILADKFRQVAKELQKLSDERYIHPKT